MKFLLALLILNIQGKRNVEFVVKDAFTGKRVNAVIKLYKGKRVIDSFDNKGKFIISISSDEEYGLYVKSKGYRPLEFKLLPSEKDISRMTVLLWPYASNSIFPKSNGSRKRIIKGYVSDIYGTMLKGVRVTLKSKGISTVTDSNGVFIFEVPIENVKISHENIPKDTILLTLPGYKTLVKEIFNIPENIVLNLIMRKGKGRIFLEEFKSPGTGECGVNEIPEKKSQEKKRGFSKRVILDPPDAIRVGTNCVGTNCDDVSVMGLETYVSTGLDDEWLASWPSHSLRAGALAYRSYGAWYVHNPINANYDICSNTYCQVWDGSDMYQSVFDAARLTAGILLEKYGNYARSEYSAENNDCGCGDGYAGDGIYWPCVSDTVCSGHSCYGHGRGMCQWGSSRWAYIGYTWKWITEHYYNPGNIDIATPMVIVSAFPDNPNINAGQAFNIKYEVYSMGEIPLYNVLLGASIYNENYGVFSDPEHDAGCVILPDTVSTVYRKFVVADTVPDGGYDLYVALWLDVDDDKRVTSKDLPLDMFVIQNAIEVGNTFIHERSSLDGFVWVESGNAMMKSINSMVFRFHIPEDSYVKIGLYDETGRVVQRYFEGKMLKGINTVYLKTGNLRDGVYFLVINRDKKEKLTRKIVVIN